VLFWCAALGSQMALWKQLHTVAAKMAMIARELREQMELTHHQSLPMNASHLKYIYANAMAFLNPALALKELQSDSTLAKTPLALSLQDDLTAMVGLYNASKRVVWSTEGATLPTKAVTKGIASFISKEDVRGALYTLEDSKTVISIGEAMQWMQVNPFSPLCSGARLTPL